MGSGRAVSSGSGFLHGTSEACMALRLCSMLCRSLGWRSSSGKRLGRNVPG